MSSIYVVSPDQKKLLEKHISKPVIKLGQTANALRMYFTDYKVQANHLDKKNRAEVFQFFEELENDILIYEDVIYFDNEEDAIMFKLVWG